MIDSKGSEIVGTRQRMLSMIRKVSSNPILDETYMLRVRLCVINLQLSLTSFFDCL